MPYPNRTPSTRPRSSLKQTRLLKDIPLKPELLVLTPELGEFVAFRRRQLVAAAARITLRQAAQFLINCAVGSNLRQFLRRTPRADQIDDLVTEFRPIGWSRLRSRDSLNTNVRVSKKPGQLQSAKWRQKSRLIKDAHEKRERCRSTATKNGR
jgi:hypothetical protein